MRLGYRHILCFYFPLGGPVVISPPTDYTTFIATGNVTFNCSGTGLVIAWVVDGQATSNITVLGRGITVAPQQSSGNTLLSQLIIPTTIVNNNTEARCNVVQVSGTSTVQSVPVKLLLQGNI